MNHGNAHRPRWSATTGVLALLLLVGVAAQLRLSIGRGVTGPAWGWPEESLLWELRGTALLSALACGAALGLSGVLLQVLLRNPLASPFVLGLSGGAGLGMASAVWLALSFPAWEWLLEGSAVGPATVGAILSLALVAWLGRRGGAIDPSTLILAGVIVTGTTGALMLLVQQMLPLETRGRLDVWMLGRIPERDAAVPLMIAGTVAAVGTIAAWRMGAALDAASLSDEEAISVGVDLPRLRRMMLLLASLLAAAATALCGPVAFVGLVAPHVARLACGARHGTLVVGSALAGALLLVSADALRQAVDVGAGRLPIGAVTAILGGPAFLILLRRYGPGSGRGVQ